MAFKDTNDQAPAATPRDIESASKESTDTSPHEPAPTSPEHETVMSKGQVVLVLAVLFMTIFLVALDRTIISTAIPKITDDFHSLDDVGWYGSAYLVTSASFQLSFGKLYTFWSVKSVLLVSIAIFEIGSAICGAAPNSTTFIVGRAFQGIGAAGIFSGIIVCIMYAVPLHKRPRIQGLFGAIFGVSSILGPLVGGAFTTHVTWRWCFYINIPFGGLALAAVVLCLKIPDSNTTQSTLKEKLLQLDGIGATVLIGAVVCLVLTLQWGGQEYSWNDGIIIALLVVMGVLAIAFVAAQIFLPRTATLPPRIFKYRSILAGAWSTVCMGASMYTFVYFLPIWFQAIQGASAVDSGLRTLPMSLSLVLASIVNGFAVQKIGYYTPSAILGACIMCVGAGLLTTLQIDASTGQWIGYQILYGFGLGICFQAPNLAAQTVLPKRDVPIGMSLMLFLQLLGASIFIPVGQSVLLSSLKDSLSGLSGIDPEALGSAGATSLSSSLPEGIRQTVLMAYNDALRHVFRVGLIVSCLAVLGVASLEFKSVKKEQIESEKVKGESNESKEESGGGNKDKIDG